MDRDLLRDEDKPYAAEVVKYLTTRGLRVELGGGAARGDQQYQDIDLLARGKHSDIVEAFRGLLRMHGVEDPFPERAVGTGLEYQIQHEGSEVQYFGMIVDERIKVKVDDTVVDISLRSEPYQVYDSTTETKLDRPKLEYYLWLKA